MGAVAHEHRRRMCCCTPPQRARRGTSRAGAPLSRFFVHFDIGDRKERSMTRGKLAACALLVVGVAVLSACSRQGPAPASVPAPTTHPQDEAQARWKAFAAQFLEDTFK